MLRMLLRVWNILGKNPPRLKTDTLLPRLKTHARIKERTQNALCRRKRRRDTRRQTKSRLKTFFSSLQRSSGKPRVAVLGEMLQKNWNLVDIFCGSFSLFFVLYFFAISSICMHSQHSQTKLSHQSYRSHTITPLSNHHTTIILKSFELRNICIFSFAFVAEFIHFKKRSSTSSTNYSP